LNGTFLHEFGIFRVIVNRTKNAKNENYRALTEIFLSEKEHFTKRRYISFFFDGGCAVYIRARINDRIK